MFAAQGVLYGIKASLKELYGSDSLAGRKVIVHGIGSVGERLIEMLREENFACCAIDIFDYKFGMISAISLYF